MAKRRSHGEGGLYWDEKRQRWIASVSLGFRANGKRIVKKASGKTKTEAKNKLKEMIREADEGVATKASPKYTVAHAVNDWLENYERTGRDPNTVKAVRSLVDNHIVPAIGARPLVNLSAEDVDAWLAAEAEVLVTSTVRNLRSILRRAISRAQVRERVKRNVVLLCDTPAGQGKGRPSNALTLAQAQAVLTAAESSPMGAYIVVSLLTGARTEEMRPLTWDHVDLLGKPKATPPIPPNIKVWRSVRARGETKTRKSRRTLALPERAVKALKAHREAQKQVKADAGSDWREQGFVFATNVGTEREVNNVRRDVRRVITAAGLNAAKWTPRELRHSFVSILSDDGMPIEEISRLVGHSSTATTELVYRKQIRPVVESGAKAMDQVFPLTGELGDDKDKAS